ncbi:MAG: hypothetical protein ACI364_03540 [Coriobacteriales bacterium]
MSGGMYSEHSLDTTEVDWADAELNAMWRDLTETGEFSPRDYGGLLKSLDFFEYSDIGEESYRAAVMAFKHKWFAKLPRDRIEFYEREIQRFADRCKDELGLSGSDSTAKVVDE